jgi:arylsulfatase A-like enzyme
MNKRLLKRFVHIVPFLLLLISFSTVSNAKQNKLPNIIYILADDMGYGDVSILNENSKLITPNIDKVGKEGVIFTDAHTNSSVCTPTRYGILTGRYAWRTRLKKGVLWGADNPLIDKNRLTVAGMLKQKGYSTACIGKWHLGLGWTRNSDNKNDINFSAPLNETPNNNGFDYSFVIPASLDIPPYVYIRNNKVTAVPTGKINKNGGKGFWREGICAPDFKHIEVLPKITEETVNYIKKQSKKENPFFIYFPLPAPHTPILPTKEFQGKSGTNEYGDFVLMTDWVVGEVLKAIKESGIDDNTLVIFTSDNGCSPQANFKELEEFGHDPSYVFRGHKADIYEGGHRVPYLCRWPANIPKGIISNETTCLTDLMATCAAIVDYNLPDNAGEDSYNFIAPMTGGKFISPLREATVHHSINGSFSIRKGDWKLEDCPGSGGWSNPRPGKATKGLPPIQLYNLKDDIAETNNVASEHPEIVQELTMLLEKYKKEGRSN